MINEWRDDKRVEGKLAKVVVFFIYYSVKGNKCNGSAYSTMIVL